MRAKTPLMIKRRLLVIKYHKREGRISVVYRGRYMRVWHERVAVVRETMRKMDQMSFAEIREFLGLADYLDWPSANMMRHLC